MTAKVTTPRTQGIAAYRQALGNYATPAPQVPPTARQMAASQIRAQGLHARTADTTPRAIKHELLSMLHARSNSGSVRLKDVSRAFDALVRDNSLSDH